MVGMHLDVYGPNQFKLGMILDDIEPFIFILVLVTMTDLRSQVCGGRKNFRPTYLKKFLVDLDGMWCTVEVYWSHESHTHLISSNQYSRERTLLMQFCPPPSLFPLDIGLHLDM